MRTTAAVLWLACVSCSADAVQPPEPTLTTPGAFVAYEESSGSIRLIRSFQSFRVDDNAFLFAAYYDQVATSYAEATALARDRSLVPRAELVGFDLAVFTAPYRVVWFRSLTDQERGTIR
jgi:hypothetical protein